MIHVPEETLDKIIEIINIGIGEGADMLNQIFSSHIRLNLVELKIFTQSELKNHIPNNQTEKIVSIGLKFRKEIDGSANLIFSYRDALPITHSFLGENIDDYDYGFDELIAEALSEIGNIVLNAVISVFSNLMKLDFEYEIPELLETTYSNLFDRNKKTKDDLVIIFTRNQFLIESLDIQGDIVILFEMKEFEAFIQKIEYMSFIQ